MPCWSPYKASAIQPAHPSSKIIHPPSSTPLTTVPATPTATREKQLAASFNNDTAGWSGMPDIKAPPFLNGYQLPPSNTSIRAPAESPRPCSRLPLDARQASPLSSTFLSNSATYETNARCYVRANVRFYNTRSPVLTFGRSYLRALMRWCVLPFFPTPVGYIVRCSVRALEPSPDVPFFRSGVRLHLKQFCQPSSVHPFARWCVRQLVRSSVLPFALRPYPIKAPRFLGIRTPFGRSFLRAFAT